MICPFCGTHIDDGLTVCPACHASLGAAAHALKSERRYCASCGALIPDGATACPSCGMPLTSEDSIMMHPLSMEGEDGAGDDQATDAIPRIISAIPNAEEPFSATSANERMPRRRVFIFAFVAALAVVGGTTLAITQPWNPQAYSTKATEEADTSKAGYPGEVSKLSGQDKGISVKSAADLDAETFQTLSDAYTQMADLRTKLGDSESRLRSDIAAETVDGDIDSSAKSVDLASGYDEAKQNASDIADIVDSLNSLDSDSGTYADQVQQVQTLAGWLDSWSADLIDAYNRATTGYVLADAILSPLTDDAGKDGTSTFQSQFDQNYASWQPQQKQSE